MTTAILAGKYPNNVIHDSWLSSLLGKAAHRIVIDDQFINYPGIIKVFWLYENVFFYAKVSVDDMAGIRFLQQQGFSLVDTNIVFEKQIDQKFTAVKDVTVRLTKPEDKEKVKMLAGSCFRYSRFHLDPAIAPELANKIKAEWVGNFFEGKRGERMVVAQKGNEIVGFLQLLEDHKGTITIDLIGVGEASRQQGVAEAMINYAQSQSPQAVKMVVGTQIANVPSVRCYEKLGFKFAKAAYVFHYHG